MGQPKDVLRADEALRVSILIVAAVTRIARALKSATPPPRIKKKSQFYRM